MPSSLSRTRIGFATGWLVWSVMDIVMLYNWGFDLPTIITDVLVTNITLGGACLLVVNNLKYYSPAKERYLHVWILCLAVTGIWSAVLYYGLASLLKFDPPYVPFFKKSMPVRFDIGFLATGAIAIMSMLFNYQEEQKENEARKAAAEKLARDAELYKLRQQLQPHFLFNSLNSISALAGSRPDQARDMIQQLSDFLRGTLKKEENQWVPLSEELQHLQLYLDIEKVRFGHRLHPVIRCDEQMQALVVPHMLLQPLVENAIKFGLYDTIGEVTISIDAAARDGYLIISVQNPYDPETSLPREGTGFGLNSVKRTLYLLFARNDLLTTVANKNVFSTIVKIPQL